MEYINIIITGAFALLGVWLGQYLAKDQIRHQSIIEIRRSVYAKFLSALRSEGSYPRDISGLKDSYNDVKVAEYNDEVKSWRKNRKVIKGLANEALLVAQRKELRDILKKFISSQDPDENSLHGVEGVMRQEIDIYDSDTN